MSISGLRRHYLLTADTPIFNLYLEQALNFLLAGKMGEDEREGKVFHQDSSLSAMLRTPQTVLLLLAPLLIEAGMNG